jgi:hypothetical protein
MKATFKPLALAAAVAAVSAGSASVTAQDDAGTLATLGDFAIIPYYTVQENWVTGFHVTNTSADTQVVKFRFRRATDSEDVLDFNLVLSPFDVWVGNVKSLDGVATVQTTDNSCTVPDRLRTTGSQAILVTEDSQEGYIEVIGMGAADSTQPISVAALHAAGTPADCAAVASNFFVAAQEAEGFSGAATTPAGGATSTYTDTPDALKVSYFIRDDASGIEFGGSAVHIADFSDAPMITHQQFGLESFALDAAALDGWDFPDVNGSGATAANRGLFDSVVRKPLGALSVINDWSYNAATGAATDWVVTLPGQYAMQDFYNQTASGDFRDLPVTADFKVFDREEAGAVPGGLGFSPAPAGDIVSLTNEVNVVSWGPENVPSVLKSAVEGSQLRVDPSAAGIVNTNGWASLAITPASSKVQSVCDHAAGAAGACTPVVNTAVPAIGFVAWQRTFADASKNYGRLIEHSFTVSSSS